MLYRGGIVNYNELAKDSDALRIRYQNMAIEVIKKNPIFGAGFHQLSIRTLEYTANDPNSPPDSGTHNIYLYLAAETGLISLAAFLLFILSLLVSALKTSSTPMEGSLLAIFIAFLFIGVCDFYPLLFQQGKLPFFLIAGLLAANVRLHKQPVLTNPSIKPVST
jgi:O-antigen ligase